MSRTLEHRQLNTKATAEPYENDEELTWRRDAKRGSEALMDAILRAHGQAVPVRRVPPLEVNRIRRRPMERKCCPVCGSTRPPMSPMIAKIQSAVISYYGIDEQELFGTRRATARPRQVAIYLTRQLTRYSLPQIGIRFDKDHTTVLHAVQKIKALLPEDDKLAADVEALTESLER